jgi:hypothetical protein
MTDLPTRVEAGEATCPTCADGGYPIYGVAPHICFDMRGPEYTIGQSLLKPTDTWAAEAYVPEIEDGETWADTAYPNGCGIFYCPTCRAGYDRAWEAVVAKHGQPPALIRATEADNG